MGITFMFNFDNVFGISQKNDGLYTKEISSSSLSMSCDFLLLALSF